MSSAHIIVDLINLKIFIITVLTEFDTDQLQATSCVCIESTNLGTDWEAGELVKELQATVTVPAHHHRDVVSKKKRRV